MSLVLVAAVGVADDLRALLHGLVDGRGEVGVLVGVGLDEQDLAVVADRTHALDVERDLAGPAGVGRRQRAGVALLVDHLERLRGLLVQAVLLVEEVQVGPHRRVVEGVDDRDRLRRLAVRVDAVRLGELSGRVATGGAEADPRVGRRQCDVTRLEARGLGGRHLAGDHTHRVAAAVAGRGGRAHPLLHLDLRRAGCTGAVRCRDHRDRQDGCERERRQRRSSFVHSTHRFPL